MEKNSGLIKYCYFIKDQVDIQNECNSSTLTLRKNNDDSLDGKTNSQKNETNEILENTHFFNPYLESLKREEDAKLILDFLEFSFEGRKEHQNELRR